MWLEGVEHMFSAKDVATAAEPDALKFDPSGNPFAPADAQVLPADKALLRMPLSDLVTAAQAAAWGAAQARAGNLGAALSGLQKALSLTPVADPGIRQQLAKVYLAQNRVADAASLIDDPKSPLMMLQALYEPPPAGFTRAIEIGEQLLQRPDLSQDANIQIWLAAAYGQQYRSEQASGAGPDRLRGIRDRVIEHVSAALQANKGARSLLHSLWKPAPGSEDDDLSGLPQNDPDLQRLLG